MPRELSNFHPFNFVATLVQIRRQKNILSSNLLYWLCEENTLIRNDSTMKRFLSYSTGGYNCFSGCLFKALWRQPRQNDICGNYLPGNLGKVKVTVDEDSLLNEAMQITTLNANSWYHQCVKDSGKGFVKKLMLKMALLKASKWQI